MDLDSWLVLSAAGVATLWLVVYVRWILPRQIEDRFMDSMSAFSRAVELRFPGHTGITEDVERVALRLARELKFSREGIRRLKTSARLMDVGLCALPYKLINGKPSTMWTDAERATYDRHPEVSGAMLDLVPSLRDLTDIVRNHHTSFSGASCEIPVEARILKVSVDYAWVTRQRGESHARAVIIEGAGREYCPEVVEALGAVLTSSRVSQPQHRLA